MKQNITAIIYDKRGRVISFGKNSYIKTHPLQALYAEKNGCPEKIYLHAEMDAIIRCQDLSKAHRILVTRISTAGNYMNAKPCKICADAISSLTGIKIIDHT